MAYLVVFALVYVFGFPRLPANPIIYIYGTITAGFPGIIGQLLIVPLVLRYIRRFNEQKPTLETAY